ncbi:MAG: hypothetical protein N2746_06640 [Deltaproteobacteria bacterium]|nr:hypothetical protein [Deltaproteobacteria bacterium]
MLNRDFIGIDINEMTTFLTAPLLNELTKKEKRFIDTRLTATMKDNWHVF